MKTAWPTVGRHHKGTLWIAAFLALVLLPGLLRLDTDNSPEAFFIDDSPSTASYWDFRQHFGSDHVLRLVVRGGVLDSAAGVEWLKRVGLGAAEIPGVEAVVSPIRPRASTVELPRVVPPQEVLPRAVLADPLDRGLGLISADGSLVSLLVILDDVDGASDRAAVAALDRLLDDPPAGLHTELVGLPVLNHALDASSREIEERFFPLLVLFAAVLLGVAFRSLAGVVLPLLFVGLSVLGVLGPMGWAGVKLNLVLAVLPPLLFVIALATALHLLMRFRDLAACDPDADATTICRATYHEKGWSVFWTGLTTAVGFASLGLSPLAPVRSLGLWAAWGLVWLTLMAFTVYPALLCLWGRRVGGPRRTVQTAKHHGEDTPADGSGGLWMRRRWALTASVVLGAVAMAGLPRLGVESNALHYLADDHPVRQAIESLEAEGIGLATLELVLTFDGSPSDLQGPNVERIGRLTQLEGQLSTEPWVLGTASAGTLLRSAAGPMASMGPMAPMALAALANDPRGREALEAFFVQTPDGSRMRLTVFVPTAGLEQLDPLMAEVQRQAADVFPETSVALTGQYPLLLESQRSLLTTLTQSFGLTLLAVAIILRLLLPGTRLALLALLPNIGPVLGVLGFMGWFGIPLDVATVMVASVALGLSVDDTLHTLGHFRHLAPRLGAEQGAVQTLRITAPAYLLTGVVLAAGFGVCALSSFAPTSRFGLLAATAIVLAVLGDLFLLPALLSLTPRSTLERWR